MQWDAYTVFSVMSGVVMLIGVVIPGISAVDRFRLALAGAAFIGYGIYVAEQTSGFFVFPVVIFIIPFAAVIYIVALAASAKKKAPPPPFSGASAVQSPAVHAPPATVIHDVDATRNRAALTEYDSSPDAMPETSGPHDGATWYPDPLNRFQQRYYNGTQWTEHVATNGLRGVDPLIPIPASNPASVLATPTTESLSGWHDDPLKRFQQRYYDGTQWTEHVVSNGVRMLDPCGPLPSAQ